MILLSQAWSKPPPPISTWASGQMDWTTLGGWALLSSSPHLCANINQISDCQLMCACICMCIYIHTHVCNWLWKGSLLRVLFGSLRTFPATVTFFLLGSAAERCNCQMATAESHVSSGQKRLKDGGILGVPKGNFNPSWNITAPLECINQPGL